MRYRYLGKTGLRVSEIALGSYMTLGHSVDLYKAQELMSIAYDHGINLFDNAEIYAQGSSEKIMGEAIRNLKWTRDSYVLMTKVFWGGPKPSQIGLHKKHIFEACNNSLKRLNVDYIDIFLCHRPDPMTPVVETVRAMHQLILQGKILYWGTSEWSACRVMEAISIAERNYLTPPSLEQFQYNMFERHKSEQEFHNLLTNHQLGATITMPLAEGLLTGKHNQGIKEASRLGKLKNTVFRDYILSDRWKSNLEKIDLLTAIAHDAGMTMAQLAIAWCLKNKYISTAIVGATTSQQILENIESCSFQEALDPNTIDKIESILKNKSTKCENYVFDYHKASSEA
jgi:voltage-dependent potassium channel beta subunit